MMSALSAAMLGLASVSSQSKGLDVHDEMEANRLAEFIDGAFIGGSWLTNPETAGDIDVVCSRDAFDLAVAADVNLSGYVKESTEQSARYNTDDDDNDYELVANWRCGNVNLIVVNPKFYPAYLAAAEHMRNHPNAFQTRELRVQLHTALKNHIRLMWLEPTWRTYMLPQSPVSFSELE